METRIDLSTGTNERRQLVFRDYGTASDIMNVYMDDGMPGSDLESLGSVAKDDIKRLGRSI